MQKQGGSWGCPTQTSTLYHTAGDTPTVTITSPADKATVNNKFTLTANVASAGTVTKVTFLLDGVPVGTTTSIPYQYSYNLPKSTSGQHTLGVKALDSNGNEGSTSITVTVSGTGGVGTDPVPTTGPTDAPIITPTTFDPRWPF
jgi:hypothetical protein